MEEKAKFQLNLILGPVNQFTERFISEVFDLDIRVENSMNND